MNYLKKIALAAGALGALALPAYSQNLPEALRNKQPETSQTRLDLPTRMTLEDTVPAETKKKQEEKTEKPKIYAPYEKASPVFEFRARGSAGITSRENSNTTTLSGLGNITLDFGNTDLNFTYRGERQHQTLDESTIEDIFRYDNKGWASITHHTNGPVYLLFGAGAGFTNEEYEITPEDSSLESIVYSKSGPFTLGLFGITSGKPNGEAVYWFDNKSDYLIVQGVRSFENAHDDAEGNSSDTIITAKAQKNFGDISAVLRGSYGRKKIGDLHKEKNWKIEAGPRVHFNEAFAELVGVYSKSDLMFQDKTSDSEKYGATLRGGIRLFGDVYFMPTGGVRRIQGSDKNQYFGTAGFLVQF